MRPQTAPQPPSWRSSPRRVRGSQQPKAAKAAPPPAALTANQAAEGAPHPTARAAVLALLGRHPDEALSELLQSRDYTVTEGNEVHAWALEASSSSNAGLYSQLVQIMPKASFASVWAATGLAPPCSLTAPTLALGSRRRGGFGGAGGGCGGACSSTGGSPVVRVLTSWHEGNLDLLRLSLASLPGWREVTNKRQGCEVVWTDAYARLETATAAAAAQVGGDHGPPPAASRLGGMKQLADKIETEAACVNRILTRAPLRCSSSSSCVHHPSRLNIVATVCTPHV